MVAAGRGFDFERMDLRGAILVVRYYCYCCSACWLQQLGLPALANLLADQFLEVISAAAVGISH